VTSARDEIWIDMIQFDVRAADQLWEGVPPAHGAPEWYDDVSGLIETAHGPAEPHELVDEPIVVDGMHRSTLGRHRCRCHDGRTVGHLIGMKAAAATAAAVLGVAATAAATTGIVATVAGMVVPAIEEHVFLVDGDQHESATPAPPVAAPPGAPAPDASPGPTEAVAASESPAPSTATVDSGGVGDAVAEPAPPAEAAPLVPVAADPAPTESPPAGPPGESADIESLDVESEPTVPPAVEARRDEARRAATSPAAGARPDESLRPGDQRAAGDTCDRDACGDPRNDRRRGFHEGDARADAATEPFEHGPRARPLRTD
jgi:hypothetical protein